MATAVQQSFPTCVLPGCRHLVPGHGVVCDTCRRDFDGYLVHDPSRVPLTEEQIHARDEGTRAAYSAMRTEPAPVVEELERRRNQTCWLCEDRRTCTQVAGRWECDTCRTAAPLAT